MILKKAIYFITLCLLIACQVEEQKSGVAPEENRAAPAAKTDGLRMAGPLPDTLCFRHVLRRDSTLISLYINGRRIKGDMRWIPYGKDGSRGTLIGTRQGDTLRLHYDYWIEGNRQQEEKIFVYHLSQLQELSAPLVEREGVLMIQPGAPLSVHTLLTQVPCAPLFFNK